MASATIISVNKNQPAPCHAHQTPSLRQTRQVRQNAQSPARNRISGPPNASSMRWGRLHVAVAVAVSPQPLTHNAAMIRNPIPTAAANTANRTAARTSPSS